MKELPITGDVFTASDGNKNWISAKSPIEIINGEININAIAMIPCHVYAFDWRSKRIFFIKRQNGIVDFYNIEIEDWERWNND